MKPITQEWVNKAEGDFATAQRELQVEQLPNYDAVCFHSQQCAEKYLKAFLQEENIAFKRTHDLSTLLDLLLPVKPNWATLRPTLDALKSEAYTVISNLSSQRIATCKPISAAHVKLRNYGTSRDL